MFEFGDVIPAGYSIEVITWENDGDNYQTCWQHGMTLEEAQYVAKVLAGTAPMGNEFVKPKVLAEYIIDNTAEKEFDMCMKFFGLDAEFLTKTGGFDAIDSFAVYSVLDGYFANSDSNYGYDFLRVVDEIKIHKFEQEIQIPAPLMIENIYCSR
ncbi:MAG: hypothetical protein ACRDCE_04230 [Cetobacterium sp.]|uniref:hypothetical protein n=1 Tax=Cetobacterium sp. TaxID=2071632 RepID=UPI003EE6B757